MKWGIMAHLDGIPSCTGFGICLERFLWRPGSDRDPFTCWQRKNGHTEQTFDEKGKYQVI